jgi:esterase/lipase superfamily enzyme
LIGRFHALTAAAIAFAICCCGCNARLSQGALVPVAQANTEGTSFVPVLVATKRKRSTADAGEMFDSERAEEVLYALVSVSIRPTQRERLARCNGPPLCQATPSKIS